MQTIRIFLASSIELETDRKAFESFLYQKSKLWQKERNFFFELVNWEDFADAMAATRLQDKYNEDILICDFFVMLCWTKVGRYTEEEFKTARKQFLETGKPLVYTYFKDAPATQEKHASLEAFDKMLVEMGHFKTVYKNTEGFLLHFNNQLDKVYRPAAVPVTPVVEEQPPKTKEHIYDLINRNDLFEAFEALNKIFLGKNDALNALLSEYINPPGNFSQAHFTSRLKVFMHRNL
jgi:hypothetical protein